MTLQLAVPGALERMQQALLHPAREVRDIALFYFTRAHTNDLRIMPIVIKAIQRYDREAAFSYNVMLEYLPVDSKSILWIIAEIESCDATKRSSSNFRRLIGNLFRADDDRENFLRGLIGCLVNADVELLRENRTAIGSLEQLNDKDRIAIDQRIEFSTMSPDALWRMHDAFVNEHADQVHYRQEDWAYIIRVVSALAAHRAEVAERTLENLSRSNESASFRSRFTRRLLAVRLAGETQLSLSIPRFIDEYAADQNMLFTDECRRAMIRIGDDIAVNALASKFADAEIGFRLSVTQVLESIHTKRSAATSLALVEQCEETTAQACLLSAALLNLYADAIEPSRAFLQTTPLDPIVLDLRNNLVVASDLLGISFPEQAAWRISRKQDAKLRKQWYS